ncbi:MAG TPA: hypothetical protein VKJ00_05500, partial [Thermoanaerobaculia bacterium]|nr:hypothetical protein [Thermoanaerobaculia bacterium]
EIFRSLRAAYMARRRRYFDEEARLFAEVLAEGRDSGALALDDPLATAHSLLLATNALLPSALSTRELGDRNQVRQQADRIADLVLGGLLARDPAPRHGDSKTHTRDGGS